LVRLTLVRLTLVRLTLVRLTLVRLTLVRLTRLTTQDAQQTGLLTSPRRLLAGRRRSKQAGRTSGSKQRQAGRLGGGAGQGINNQSLRGGGQ
jgi:hypothetical protein